MSFVIKSFLKALLETASNLKQNKENSVITIFTIAVAVSILGLFLLIYFNLNNILHSWSEKLQLVVYLEDNIPQNHIANIEEMMRNEPGIGSWDFFSKDDALVAFRKRLKDKSNILDGLDANPLPASFNVFFKEDYRNYEEIKSLANKLNSMDGIEDVDYGGGWIARFEAAILFFRIFILAVGGLLGMGLIAIISNTIRLSVYSRSDEIEIKKLVGASRWFIQAPFLVEGVIQGLAGVFLALGLLLLFYTYVLLALASSSQILMGLSVEFIPYDVIFLMIFSGGMVGGIGSWLSLGKLMRFDQSA